MQEIGRLLTSMTSLQGKRGSIVTAGTPHATKIDREKREAVFAPSSIGHFPDGSALIASNLNYTRGPEGVGIASSSFAVILLNSITERERGDVREDVENIQNRIAISVHSDTAPPSRRHFVF